MPPWLADAVSTFGSTAASKLAGPGDKEAAIRAPLEALLRTVGEKLGLVSEFYDEVRDTERQVRPDYGVSVNGVITGYIEVKAPGKNIDPSSFRGHDKRQWDRQKDLPNLLYTNGTEWRLYRDAEPVGDPVKLDAVSLEEASVGLGGNADFLQILTNFLRWAPAPIISVGALVRAIAPLTRLLRGEVLDQIEAERRALTNGAPAYEQPFLGLAHEWRALLFPQASDETFADGYAQTVTFALLMARTEGIAVSGVALPTIGEALKADHSLMGRALQLLTLDVASDFKVTLDLLTRVIGVVDWPRIRKGRRDLYLHLYEHFLEEYDNTLRKSSGSYYTPREIVEDMVRLTEEALSTRLGKSEGFADPSVLTIDPAMGTGTYLHTILDTVAERVEKRDGPGAVAGVLGKLAPNLVGFELQMGPYTVAELRLADMLRKYAGTVADRPRLFVTDTLDDPYAVHTQLSGGLQTIAAARKKANEIKASAPVTVVIGNPPYGEHAEGMGGWVEAGSAAGGTKEVARILDDWRDPASARHAHNLKNLYVYFWRWATWKVFESTPELPDGDSGIVCFITTSGYITGPGFSAMRRYLREWASEGWVIDVTPEGQTPEISTRVFPGVRQPLAIALFVRQPEKDRTQPAKIRYRSISGRQSAKFKQLSEITLDGTGWRDARTEWTAPLTPAAEGEWDTYPALSDLFPWTSPGVTGNRRWPYAPNVAILKARWSALRNEQDPKTRAKLFKETDDRRLDSKVPPLPGIGGEGLRVAVQDPSAAMPEPIRIGYRSFDRQWIIPDRRLLDRPRPSLWEAQIPGQIFTVEFHAQVLKPGPALVFSALMPDLAFFKGSEGGRTLPVLHPDGSPNVATGLLAVATSVAGHDVSATELLAYVAGVVSHPAFTHTFEDALRTPGIRVPFTRSADLWAEAVSLGETVIWCHTYGERYSTDARPQGNVRYASSDHTRTLSITPILGMPETIAYDEDQQILRIGTGAFGPVSAAVWNYQVGGKRTLKSWFDYRKAIPGGKRTSPLDDVHVHVWDADWTSELLDLLATLRRLTDLEQAQADVLNRILKGSLVSRGQLAESGVVWPNGAKDRQPRSVIQGDGVLDLPEL